MKEKKRFPVVKPRDKELQKKYVVAPSGYPDNKWAVTFFGHTQKKHGILAYMDFEQLVRHIALPQRKAEHWDGDAKERDYEKKCQKCFAPVEFKDNRRLKENVMHCSLFVWDVDCGKVTYDQVKKFMDDTNTMYIMHTSYSHTPEKHKFRVILPMTRPFPAQYWDAYAEISEELFHKGFKSWPDLQALKNRACTYNCAYLTPHYRADWNEGGLGTGVVNLHDIVQARFEKHQHRKARAILDKQFASSPGRRRDVCHVDDRTDRLARLISEEGAREKFALSMGARKKGEYWTKWTCPGCGKNDATAFHEKRGLAFCNHKNSCGLSWLITELAALKNWNG